LRLTHKDGVIYYTNLLSVGFAADVAMLRTSDFKASGSLAISCRFFFAWRGWIGGRFQCGSTIGASLTGAARCFDIHNSKFNGRHDDDRTGCSHG